MKNKDSPMACTAPWLEKRQTASLRERTANNNREEKRFSVGTTENAFPKWEGKDTGGGGGGISKLKSGRENWGDGFGIDSTQGSLTQLRKDDCFGRGRDSL